MSVITAQNETVTSLTLLRENQHHEILDAMDKARELYDERSSTPLLIVAIDDIYQSAEAHFQDEEELLEVQLANSAFYAHRELHKRILNQVASMRKKIEYFDRVNLLSQLRFLDAWLNSHISDEYTTPAARRFTGLRGKSITAQNGTPGR